MPSKGPGQRSNTSPFQKPLTPGSQDQRRRHSPKRPPSPLTTHGGGDTSTQGKGNPNTTTTPHPPPPRATTRATPSTSVTTGPSSALTTSTPPRQHSPTISAAFSFTAPPTSSYSLSCLIRGFRIPEYPNFHLRQGHPHKMDDPQACRGRAPTKEFDHDALGVGKMIVP